MTKQEYKETIAKSLEKKLIDIIKPYLEKEISNNGLEYVANRLGLLPTGLALFVKKDHWSLIDCLWIAREIKHPIYLSVEMEG